MAQVNAILDDTWCIYLIHFMNECFISLGLFNYEAFSLTLIEDEQVTTHADYKSFKGLKYFNPPKLSAPHSSFILDPRTFLSSVSLDSRTSIHSPGYLIFGFHGRLRVTC